MENKIKTELDGINTELSALADTFVTLDDAHSDGVNGLQPQALYIPTKHLCELSNKLENIVKQLYQKEQPQCQS